MWVQHSLHLLLRYHYLPSSVLLLEATGSSLTWKLFFTSLQCFHMHFLIHLLCFIKMCNFKHSFLSIFAAQEPSSINKVRFFVIWAQSRFIGLTTCYQLNSCFSLHVCCEVVQCVTHLSTRLKLASHGQVVQLMCCLFNCCKTGVELSPLPVTSGRLEGKSFSTWSLLVSGAKASISHSSALPHPLHMVHTHTV